MKSLVIFVLLIPLLCVSRAEKARVTSSNVSLWQGWHFITWVTALHTSLFLPPADWHTHTVQCEETHLNSKRNTSALFIKKHCSEIMQFMFFQNTPSYTHTHTFTFKTNVNKWQSLLIFIYLEITDLGDQRKTTERFIWLPIFGVDLISLWRGQIKSVVPPSTTRGSDWYV